jgi:hypothetical protein
MRNPAAAADVRRERTDAATAFPAPVASTSARRPRVDANGRLQDRARRPGAFACAARLNCSIPVDADVIDLDYRADHLEAVLNALSVYLTAILDDTAQNTPGGLDLCHIEAALSNLASDVTSAIQRAADGIAGRVA